MSPPGGRRCPPALLALLLGLAGSRGEEGARGGGRRPGQRGCGAAAAPGRGGARGARRGCRRLRGRSPRFSRPAVPRDSRAEPRGRFPFLGSAWAAPSPRSRDSRGSALGSPKCQNLTVGEGGSLCLVPDKTLRNWIIIQWKMEIYPTAWQQILTASRDGAVSSPRGPFHGRAKFQPGNFSLCISPAHRADNGVYRVEFQSSSRISSRCFRVSVWEPQICLCNVSSPAGWSAARALLTCPEIPDNFGHWRPLVVALAEGLTLLLVGGCCWWREKRKNSREGLSGMSEQDPKFGGSDPTLTLGTPKSRSSGIKTSQDNGGYRRLRFPNPAGHQRP
uniref:uncharacterized protein n=1 Tax=Lonchura striata TaxID=40157 RepID=UPI001293F406|nr:uncharacterized protein LOC110476890 [Lonchura striata domestica]